jgi:hypothetical protein
VFTSGLPSGDEVFGLAAAAVTLSIVLHSSTDALVARSFHRLDEG